MGSIAIDPLNLDNVQGDILTGLPKKAQSFIFFEIVNTVQFKNQLQCLIPLITTTSNISSDRKRILEHKARRATGLVELSHINIAFSKTGLDALAIPDNLGDDVFSNGMKNDATDLGDNLENWDAKFTAPEHLHGVILVTGSDETVRNETVANVYQMFHVGDAKAGFSVVLQLDGQVRPGLEDGHEHFGFNDGLSQPAVKDVPTPEQKGQETVRQGVILLGREGDAQATARPAWALDGSFLAFRYLQQLVPEFNKFLSDNALPGNPDLLGARLVGRWKSGASVFASPNEDKPELALPEFNQDFRYNPLNQDACPFAAHARKTNPRADLDAFGGTEQKRILRRGIQFGPEVTPEEANTNTSSTSPDKERGLLFVCYQSNLKNGFQFIQQSWANNTSFPPQKFDSNGNAINAGFDPIIGQGPNRNTFGLVGSNPANLATTLGLPIEWVVSKGGEYFISPSIPALRDTFAKAATQTEL